jgi:nucleoside-diphosphate kinase
MANTDRTLIIVKPDGVQRGLAGTILSRLEQRGLKLAALKLIQMDRPLAERHYEALRDKSYYPGLIDYITSRPVIVGVVEGPNAFKTVRATMGDTDPLKAAPGTIRFDFGVSIGRNLIHGSDSAESAEREINLFFRPEEILAYPRETDRWILEE